MVHQVMEARDGAADEASQLARQIQGLNIRVSSLTEELDRSNEMRAKLEVNLRKQIMEELQQGNNSILVMDELHTLVGAGAAEGAIDAANILKPALARGELQCIGATTIEEYRKYIEKDAALERRFQPVQVDEPSIEETVEMRYLTEKMS